jgi:hypothetical protein
LGWKCKFIFIGTPVVAISNSPDVSTDSYMGMIAL